MDRADLTYGVELEYVHAYREEDIERYTPNLEVVEVARRPSEEADPPATRVIIKNLPYPLRNNAIFNQVRDLHNRAYKSWGLVPNPGPSAKLPIRDALPYGREKNTTADGITRPYNSALNMAAQQVMQRLSDRNCTFHAHRNIKIEWTISNKEADKVDSRYSGWTMTAEPSVRGVGSDLLARYLPNRVNEQNKDQWDSYGIEISTPVMRVGNAHHINQIRAVCKVLNGLQLNQDIGFVTNQCGLHVHVGVSQFSLEVLQMLAFITVVYEDLTATMFPPTRRPGHVLAHNNLESNRHNIVLAKVMSTEPLPDKSYVPGDMPMIMTTDEVFENISSTTSKAALAKRMGKYGRNSLINWSNIYNPPGRPRTVEFRQHEGTIGANIWGRPVADGVAPVGYPPHDIRDIERWVEFCTGFVRVAEMYTNRAQGHGITHWGDGEGGVDLENLMNDMQLKPEARSHWIARVRLFSVVVCGSGTKWDRDDCEAPPEIPQRQRAEINKPRGLKGREGVVGRGAEHEGKDKNQKENERHGKNDNKMQTAAGYDKTSDKKRKSQDNPEKDNKKQKMRPEVAPTAPSTEQIKVPQNAVASAEEKLRDVMETKIHAAGSIAEEEMCEVFGFDDSFAVNHFDFEGEWTRDINTKIESGGDSAQCGLFAIAGSLANQYPADYEYLRSNYPRGIEDMKQIVRAPLQADLKNHTFDLPKTWYHTEQLAMLLDVITESGKVPLKLVYCTLRDGSYWAYRAHFLPREKGRNVYVFLDDKYEVMDRHGQVNYVNHWETMSRKQSNNLKKGVGGPAGGFGAI